MALKSGLFNSVSGDRKYKAEDFARYFSRFIANGVFPNPSTGMQVIANDNMTVSIKAGDAWINGYYITNDADYNLTIDVADGVFNRIDRIVLQLNYLNREIVPIVKKGAFATVPVAPALQRNADAYEIALADVYIGKGAISITQANITDLRLNTSLCGVVHGTVNQVDTTTLFNQYQSWINQQKAEYEADLATWTSGRKLSFDQWLLQQQTDFTSWRSQEEQDFVNWRNDEEQDFDTWSAQQRADFDAWYASIQDILDENVATNLQNQINQIANEVTQLAQTVDENTTEIANTQQTVATHLAQDATDAHRAENISLDSANFAATELKGAMDELFTNVSDGKTQIATAITDKGVSTSSSDSFSTMADNIGQISSSPPLWELPPVVTYIDNDYIYGASAWSPPLTLYKYTRDGELIFSANVPLITSVIFSDHILEGFDDSKFLLRRSSSTTRLHSGYNIADNSRIFEISQVYSNTDPRVGWIFSKRSTQAHQLEVSSGQAIKHRYSMNTGGLISSVTRNLIGDKSSVDLSILHSNNNTVLARRANKNLKLFLNGGVWAGLAEIYGLMNTGTTDIFSADQLMVYGVQHLAKRYSQL